MEADDVNAVQAGKEAHGHLGRAAPAATLPGRLQLSDYLKLVLTWRRRAISGLDCEFRCTRQIIRTILLMAQSKGLRPGTQTKAADVSPDTIRHYEKIGVLPRASRKESGRSPEGS